MGILVTAKHIGRGRGTPCGRELQAKGTAYAKAQKQEYGTFRKTQVILGWPKGSESGSDKAGARAGARCRPRIEHAPEFEDNRHHGKGLSKGRCWSNAIILLK